MKSTQIRLPARTALSKKSVSRIKSGTRRTKKKMTMTEAGASKLKALLADPNLSPKVRAKLERLNVDMGKDIQRQNLKEQAKNVKPLEQRIQERGEAEAQEAETTKQVLAADAKKIAGLGGKDLKRLEQLHPDQQREYKALHGIIQRGYLEHEHTPLSDEHRSHIQNTMDNILIPEQTLRDKPGSKVGGPTKQRTYTGEGISLRDKKQIADMDASRKLKEAQTEAKREAAGTTTIHVPKESAS